MKTHHRNTFTTIRTKGAILPPDLLQCVSDPAASSLEGLQPSDYHLLLGQPIVTIRQVEAGMEVSNYKIAQRYVKKLVEHGILREVTGKARNRVYRADKILGAIVHR